MEHDTPALIVEESGRLGRPGDAIDPGQGFAGIEPEPLQNLHLRIMKSGLGLFQKLFAEPGQGVRVGRFFLRS